MVETGLATKEKIALVTGAGGLIGRRLCHRLQQLGWHVIALQRSNESGPWDRLIRSDLAGNDEIVLPAGIAIVFHLAGKAHALSETAQDDDEYFAINTAGTVRMLEAARRASVPRFIMFSSVKAMGEGGAVAQDETAACLPETPYGQSKLAAEKAVLQGGYVAEPVVLRLSMVYGLSEKGNLPRMIEAVSKGRFPPLPELHNRRSMVHVEDVVQAALLAAHDPKAAGQTFIVTDGQQYSTRQIYLGICHALHKPVPQWIMPVSILRFLARIGDAIGRLRQKRFVFDSDALEKLVGSSAYSSGKLQTQLGYRPEYDLLRTLQSDALHLGRSEH